RRNLAAGDTGVGWWAAEGRVTDEREATSDETLCRRIAARDDAAFDVLVARYQGRAYRLAWSLLRDAEDARDVSQEAFIRVWEAVHRLSPQQRTAVILHAQEQLSTAEIAEVLKVAEPTVRVHLHRAVTALRRELAP